MGGYKFKHFIGEEVPFAVQKKGWGGMGADFMGRKRSSAAKKPTTTASDSEESEGELDAEFAPEQRTVLINETITTPVGVEKNRVMYSKVKTEKKTRTTVAASKKKTTQSITSSPATVEQFFVSSTVTKKHDDDESDEEETPEGVIDLGHV